MPSPIKGTRKTPELRLPALLSQVLVAYTIEFDNEVERQVPHRTTEGSGSGPESQRLPGSNARLPWLVSLVIYSNFLRFVPEEGITVRDLYLRSGLEKDAFRNLLKRLVSWWSYLTLTPPRGKSASKDSRGDWIVLPSEGGLPALRASRDLFPTMESRWQERFGSAQIAGLRTALAEVTGAESVRQPAYLPVLGNVWEGWFAHQPSRVSLARDDWADPQTAPLFVLLSRVLMAFALDFEREWELSLAIGFNLIRVVDDTGVRLRDFPRLSGVSKEAIKMMLGFCTKHRFVTVEARPDEPRTKQARLTAKGIGAKDAFDKRLVTTEKEWQKKFGPEAIKRLRSILEAFVGDPKASPLLEGLRLHPEGWRASRPFPETLPFYPLPLHRGGFPDGA